MTYKGVYRRVHNIAENLEAMNIPRNSRGLRIVGILCENRPEWLLTEFACITRNIVTLGLYAVQSSDSVGKLLEDTEVACICASAKYFQTLITLKEKGFLSHLRIIIEIDNLLEEERRIFQVPEIKFYSFRELLKSTPKLSEPSKPSPDCIFTLCCTSGTTNSPKLAVITHRNMLGSLTSIIKGGYEFKSSDLCISYIPLAHLADRVVDYGIALGGGCLAFSSSDLVEFKHKIELHRPTILFTVPRVLNVLHDQIKNTVATKSKFKQRLFNATLRSKIEAYESKGTVKSSFWSNFAFKDCRLALGGRLRLVCTGTAPVNSEILRFIRIVLGCAVIHGYGLVEASVASACSRQYDNSYGHVGGPLPCCEFKLDQGEICIRGHTVFPGYYNAPSHTLDSDGWLRTGDIGTFVGDRKALKIIDRISNLVKLSNGAFVALESLEVAYQQSSFVSQVMVYGDTEHSQIVGIVVPDQKFVLKCWAPENQIPETISFEEICNTQQLKSAILNDLDEIAKANDFCEYQKIRVVHLETSLWTPFNILTPTQKLKRSQAYDRYNEVINNLYQELSQIK